jgi:CubicO group peptidase (beta-lactamase class C family)
VPFPRTRQVLDAALAAGAFPAAVVDVGTRRGRLWTEAWGRLTTAVDAPACTTATVFDLASLTKVMATTPLLMRLVDAGGVDLDTALARLLTGWAVGDRGAIRVRHLLDHSAGLRGHDRLWERASGRREYEAAIRALPLERPPGAAAVYSDLGFMLLGFIAADLAERTLDDQFARLTDELGIDGVGYRPPSDWRARTAPTEFDPWRGRLLVGEVHDENAAALEGVAGHAGLFGTAAAVGAYARVVLETFDRATPIGSPELMRTFATRTGVPGSSRALGWDTMLPTSSCGTRLSSSAIGHTGYTGTSLWIDRLRDLYVVLLTNRVHPTRANDQLTAVRPRVHDAIVADIEAGQRM